MNKEEMNKVANDIYERINWIGFIFKEGTRDVSGYRQLKSNYKDSSSRLQEVRCMSRMLRKNGIISNDEYDTLTAHIDYIHQDIHTWFLATDVTVD